MSLVSNKYNSVCSGCELGCGVVLTKDRNNRIQVEGNSDHPVNKGLLCSKGMNLHFNISDTSQRLLVPQMRWGRTQPLKQVDWDLAFSRASAVLRSVTEEFGPQSVAVYMGGNKTLEEYYLAYKLFQGCLGINNIESSSIIKDSSLSALSSVTGSSIIPVTSDDLDKADCFFIAGLDLAVSHPVLVSSIRERKSKDKSLKVIVADQKKTETAGIADYHIQLNPGTEIVYYNAIGRFLIENGLADREFLAQFTEGFEDYVRIVFERSLAEAAEICDIQVEEIINVAQVIGQSHSFVSIMKAGKQFNGVGEKHNTSLLNLSGITGHLGKPGSGPFIIPTNESTYGLNGKTSVGFPLLSCLSDKETAKEVAGFWGRKNMPPLPATNATDMFDGLLSGHYKVVILLGTNPLKDLPDARNVEVALKNARFVILQDYKESELSRYADLVLPSAAWPEKEGTISYTERRISFMEKAINPPGEALSDLQIFIRLAGRLGFGKDFSYDEGEEIFKEYASISSGRPFDISGLSYEILREELSVNWPYKSGQVVKDIYNENKFNTRSGKLKITPLPDFFRHNYSSQFPLVLSGGNNSSTQIFESAYGRKKIQEEKPVLQIHELDALTRNIGDGDICEIFNNNASVKAVAVVTGNIKSGVVQLPEFWASKLIKTGGVSSGEDTVTLKPAEQYFPTVEVRRYIKPREKLIVIGAGASSYRFLQRFRELNTEDDILVFSREKNQFYNRILLPEYISGNLDWQQLVKIDNREIISLDLELFPGTGITSIDRENKIVIDEKGRIHNYDKLILATGSRANRPVQFEIDKEGIFTMRQREDAEKLMSSVDAESVAVIVGGGLLGIEIADALSELGVTVSVVQRSSRLMDRQLDSLASELLHEELLDRGIKVYFNDEILSIKGTQQVEGVKLKSGKSLKCDILIYAIGTVPNIEIARAAGLKCNRGIVVDNHLKTSDPDIFAMGEIAEHYGVVYGITAAAEEQAEILAEYLNGNVGAVYDGSVPMNILKVKDLDLCSIGIIDYPKEDKNYQSVVIEDKAVRYYKKCVIYRDRLVGAILIGDKTEFNEFRKLIKEEKPLGEKRKFLLKPGGPGKSDEVETSRIICNCNKVTEQTITLAAEKCRNIGELCNTTGAGTGCGSCKNEIKKILEKVNSAVIRK
jgi:ferredoxin-nitrate reductase